MSTPSFEKTGDILQINSYLLGVPDLTEKTSTAVSIGIQLAQLRKEKGVTQGEMAKLLNVSQPMVSDYERGALRLHGELILQITDILKVSANDILGVKEIKEAGDVPKNRRLARRIQAIDTLPKRDQDALMRTIDAFLSKAV